MKSGKWEIIEQNTLERFVTKVWLVFRDGIPQVASIVNGQLQLTKIEEGKEYPPTLDIPYDAWQAIKRAMVDEKVREKSEVEAELGATKYHLEDMRKLALKELTPNPPRDGEYNTNK